MVDALEEIERVLVPGGTVLDLRPAGTRWPLEIAVAGQAQTVAGMAREPGIRTDRECREAWQQRVDAGRFRLERQQFFDYVWYWDTLEEMRAHVEGPCETWHPPVSLTRSVLTEAEQQMAAAHAAPRVRIRFRTSMEHYRKRE